jgi:hypothetical protein
MAIYKVSFVIIDNDNPGTILNQDHMPYKGERLNLMGEEYEVIEVLELVPPRGDFHYIHSTCRPTSRWKGQKT